VHQPVCTLRPNAYFCLPYYLMTRKARIQTGTIIAGIFTALVIVVSQLFYFEAHHHTAKKEVKTEHQQHNDQSSDGAFITLPSSTLPSSTHVEFNQEIFCLFEILFEEEKTEEHDFSVSLPLSRFFQTLFEDIISPNAP